MEPHDAIIANVIAKRIILIKMSVLVLGAEVFSSGIELPVVPYLRRKVGLAAGNILDSGQ
jgi:hypothetical protein